MWCACWRAHARAHGSAVFFYGLKSLRHSTLERSKANRQFMWFYFIGTLLVLSMTTPNLGIAVRQKWMFIPMFLYLFISAIACDNQKPRLRKHSSNKPPFNHLDR